MKSEGLDFHLRNIEWLLIFLWRPTLNIFIKIELFCDKFYRDKLSPIIENESLFLEKIEQPHNLNPNEVHLKNETNPMARVRIPLIFSK